MNYVLVIKPNGTKVRYPATPDKVIPAKPGDEIVLVDHNGEPVDVDLKADEEDLLVTFEDGLSVTLQDFYNEDGDLDPVTIGIKPSIDSFDTYEFNSQVGNLPSEGEFSLMRFSNTRGLDFLDPRSGTLGIFSAAEGASTDFMSPVPEDKNPAATADSSGSGGATGDQATTTENAPTVIDLLANDSDPEGGTLRIYAIQGVPVATGDTVNLPGGGKVLLNVDGTVTYTPGEDFNSLGVGEEAVDTFSYSIIDQGGNVASSTVSVTILGENDGPLAENDFARGAEDQPIYNIPVLGNDTDADGDTLSIVGTPTASNGVVGVNPNGSLNYIPNADFNGVDTITYTITDPHGATSTATVSVVVDAVNDLPVANSDVASVNEDSSLTGFDLIGNDTDVDGDTLTLSGTPTAENGTIVVNGDGTIDYTPDPDFTGTDVITYIVSDGNGGSDTSTLTVTVNPVNDAPVGVDDVAMTDEDARIYNLDVLKNDTDVDGDTLSIQGVPTANNGTISVNSDGTLNYTPDADFNGTDTITYIVEDGNGASDTATVTVTVNAVNDAPVAVSDIGSGNEDVSITGNVLGNDTDVDNLVSTLTVVSNTTPAHGTLVIGSDGAYTYTPDANFNGVDSFSYTISDPGGATSSATVTLNVGAVNDAPVAADDAGSVNEDSVLTITAANGLIQSNDSDVDGNTLTVSAIRTGAESGSGTAGSVGVNLPGSLGTLNVAADGSYTYAADQAAADALGVGETSTDIFTYTISDGAGGSDSAEVIITVTGTNDGPVAVADTGAVAEDATSTVNAASGVLSNDTDLDVSDSHEVSAIRTGGESGSGTGALVGNALVGTYGTLTMESDGSYSYTADQAAANALADGEQVTDTFTYTVSDGNGGTDSAELVITVTGTNDGPVSNPPGGTPGVYDDSDSVAEDTVAPITGDVLANDSDPDGDTLSVSAVDGDAGKVGVAFDGSYGELTLNSNGTYSYELDNGNAAVQALGVGETAVETFSYTADDGEGGSATATLSITITGTNDAPVANPSSGPGVYDDSDSIAEDAFPNSATGNVLSNDSDPDGDTLSVSAVNGTGANTGVPVAGSYGSITINSNGSYNYALNNNNAAVQALGVGETATETFSYTASDGNGGSATASLTITITGTNDAPTANPSSGPGVYNDTDTVAEDTVAPITGDVLLNDSDPDGDTLSVTSIGGSAVSAGTPGVAVGSYGTITQAADGSYSYALDNGNAAVQALGVGETAVETFSYIASDGQGGSATATLSITITGTNDAPVANPVSGPGVYDDTNAVTEDSVVPVTGNVISNDSDPDGDTLSVSAVEGGAGNVGSEHDGSYGAITLNSNGTYSYELDNSNAAVQALAAGATLTETFDYTANDGNGGSATATLSITITGTNDGPVAVSDIGSGNEDVSITGNVLGNDTDVDNLVSTLTVVSNTTPAHGTLVIGSDGAYTYTPDANFNGVDSFSYTISDPGGATSSATVTLNVGAVNDAPVAADDAGSVNEDSVLTITAANGLIQSNDSDVDGNTLTVSAIRTGAESGSGTAGSVGVNLPGSLGTLNVAADGSYTYAADQAAADALGVGETSTDIFTYTISDGAGGSDSAEVIITVTGTNDGPVAVADTGAVAEDATSTVNAASGVLSNDTDLDVSDSHEVSAIRTGGESGSGTGALVGNALVGTYGTLTMESDGSYSYTADQAAANALADGEQVTDTFTYTVSDGNGGTDSAELVITVTGTNDGPVSNPPGGTPGVYDDSDSVAEDTVAPITGDVLANDSDPDGDTLSVSAVDGDAGKVGVAFDGSYGELTLNSNGTYSYELDNGNAAVQALGVGETAVETFSYTADDGEGGSATATLSITITGTNDAPVANPSSGPGVYDDSDSIAEDAFPNSATGNVLSNDSDPDGDTLSVSAVNGTGANTGVPVAGSYGSITINSNGSYNYALNNNNAAVQALGVGETATETFSYTASDGNGGSATASLTITITGTNDAPTANPSSGPGVYNDTDTVAEDTVAPITGDVLLNDSDPDGDTLSVTSIGGSAVSAGTPGVAVGSYGTITQAADGSYSYALDNGNAAVQALGVGETAVETFSYIASDGQGGSATATLSITITGTNDAPVAIADTGSTTQGTTTLIDVLGNDTDPDTNDTLTVVSVVQPLTGGSVSITENKVRFDPGSDFDYLDDGETADVTFDYTVSDGMGGTDTATVTVTVTGADDPLVAVADFGSTTENAQLVLSVLANDLEPDTTDKPLTVTAVSAPSLGSVSHDGTNITFDPGSDFDSLTSGESQDVTFNYTVTNQDGATDIETVTITVNGVNDAPETHADTLHTIEGVGRAVDVIANDSDAESTQLQVSHINGAAVGPNAPVILSSGATVSLMEDGRVYFNPNGRYADLDFGETATESFTYTVVDSEGGTATETVTVTIDGTDEEEVISGAYQVLSDQLYEIQLDPADESIVYVPIGDPLPFSFNSIAFNSNDNLIYATAQGSDAGLGVATKDVILISPLTGRVVGNIGQLLNDQGEAINDYAGAINSDINVYYVNGTSDSAGNTTYAIDLDPSSPTYLSVTGVGGLPGADYGVDPNTGLLWSVNGTTTYSLDPTSGVLTTYNNNGGVNGSGNPVSGTFGSMFSDGDGNIQVTANNGDGFFRVNTANGDLIRIADAPVSNSNDATGTLETALPSAQPFLFLDTDGSTGAPTARDAVRVYDPAGSSVSIADNDTSIADLDGDVISSAEIILKNPQSGDEFVTAGLPSGITASIATRGGYLVVTLSGDASQTDYASAIEAVRFQNSGGGAVLTDPRQITVTVTDENGVASNPASSTIFIGSSGGTAAFRDTQTEDGAFADSLHVHEDDNDVSTGGATLNLLTNDSDNPTTITGITQPPAGEGTVTNNGDGTVTFNPGNDFQYLTDGETASTTFTYTTSTGETETVTMTIHGANDPIVAVADSAMAPADEVTTIDVLANDSDPDSVDQPLSITATTQPPKGSVTTDGSHVFFNPGSDFAGLAPGATEVVTFIYTVSNASGEVENELVTVTVTGPNDDPVALNDIGAVNEDATSSVGALAGVLSNDTDPDVGAVLMVAAVRTGAEAASGTAGTVGASLVGNYGTLTLAADGSYTYVADQAAADALANGATANDVFTYTVSDGFGGSDTAELSITVTGTNDAPVASAESGTVKEDVTPTASGQLDATDEEGDTLAFSRNSTGTPGTEAGDNGYGDFTINANGTWSYSLDNANGSVNGLAVGETITDTITYRATAGGGTDTETITVTIEGTNDGPVAVNDSYSVSKGSTVTIDPRSNDTDVDGDSLSITAIEDSTGTLVTPVTGTPITLASGATVTLNADGRLSYEAPAVDIVVTEVADDQAWTHAISETGSDESYDAKTITYTGLSGYSQGSLSLTLSVDGTYDDSIAIDLDGDGVIDYIVTEEDFRSSGAVGYTPWTDASPLSFEVLVTTTGTTVVTTWDGVVITPGAGGAPVNGPGHGGGFDNVSGFTLETLGYNPDGTVPSDDFTTSQIRLGTLNDGGPSESGISFAIQINNLVVEDTFDYRIDDGNGGTDIATVTVEVDPLNQAPTAVDDEYSINEGEPFTATLANGLLLNDTDLEGDTLTVNTTPVSGPSNGVLALSADGTFTYTPNDGFMGRDSFTYEVNDGNGGVSSAVATILIDNDRDGYTNDIDFDDDNDGILDTEECLAAGDGIDHTGHSHSLPIIDSLYNGIVDPIADAVLFDHDAYGIFVSGSGLIAGGNTDGRGFIDSGWYKATGGHYEEDTNFSGTTFSNGTVSVSSFAPSLLGISGTSSAATLGTTDTVTSSGDADADLVSGDSGTGLAIETASSLAAPAVTTVSIDFTDPVYSFGFDLNDLFDGGVLQGVLPTVTIEIDGDTVLRFVGADVLAGGGSLSAAVRDSDDNLVLGQNGLAQVVLVGNNTETFIGFTSPTPVSQVQINYGTTLLSLTVDEIGLDNFRYSTTPPCDIDGDGIGNRLDLDSDGDGVFEVDEASGVDLDLDNDGMVDGAVDANGVPIAASGGLDPDGGPSNPYDDSSVPPIVIDMDGDGVEFNSIDDGILLDVDGDGELERTAWANEDDAVLIFDGNDNGKVDGPDEFAFARYSDDPNATDLDGLRAGFDSDGDLILTAEDDEWANFKLWQDADGDGQVGEGELFTLDEAGIESIGLTSDGNSYSAADGDVYVHGEAVVNYADGSTGTAADSAFDFRELLDDSDDDALEVMSESGEVVNLDESDFPEVLGSPVVDQGDIIVPEGSPNASVDELAANEAAMQ